VLQGIYPKNLVGERLPDLVDPRKIEDHDFEPFEPGQQALGLGPGNELLGAVFRQSNGNDRPVETEILSGRRVFLENLLYGTVAPVPEGHDDGRPFPRAFALQDPVLFFPCLVGEVHASGKDHVIVEHP